MSTSSDLESVRRFVENMRQLGADRVRVGEVEVSWDGPTMPPAPPQAPIDPKKQDEELMYGSSV